MNKMVEKVDQASQGGFMPAVIYEYFPLQKINSVPIRATAFRRETTPNVLITLSWDPSQDKTEEARAISKDIIDTIVERQNGLTSSEKFGYTNYGEFYCAFDLAETDIPPV